MKRFMFYVVFAVAVMGLAACSGGPSTSESKAAVWSLIGGPCPRLSISEFEKVNGLAQGDASYQVSVKYLLVVSPPGQGQQSQAAYGAKLADIRQRHQQLQARIDAQDKTVQDLQVQVMSYGHLGLQDQFTQQSQQLDGMIAQRTSIEAEEQQALGEPLAQFQAACPSVSASAGQRGNGLREQPLRAGRLPGRVLGAADRDRKSGEDRQGVAGGAVTAARDRAKPVRRVSAPSYRLPPEYPNSRLR